MRPEIIRTIDIHRSSETGVWSAAVTIEASALPYVAWFSPTLHDLLANLPSYVHDYPADILPDGSVAIDAARA